MIEMKLIRHRVLSACLAVLALGGWGAYLASRSSSAARDAERVETIRRITEDRDGLVAYKARLQEQLASVRGQVAAAEAQIASLELQQKVSSTSSIALNDRSSSGTSTKRERPAHRSAARAATPKR